MNFCVKQVALCLLIINYNAFGIGDLEVTNTTLGIVRFNVVRNNLTVFSSPAIQQGDVLKRTNLLNTGDQITFKVADNTIGPVLPDYTVGNLHGRTADVIITCNGDQCDTQEL